MGREGLLLMKYAVAAITVGLTIGTAAVAQDMQNPTPPTGYGMQPGLDAPQYPLSIEAPRKPLILASEVKIGLRNGGDLLTHINQATYMMSTGHSYRVVGDQYSAAAMQVLLIESQYPERVCAARNAKLHFHLAFDPITKINMKEPDWYFTAFIRPENLKRLGTLPEYGHGFKTVRASDYLGLCKTKTVNCNVKCKTMRRMRERMSKGN